MKTVLLNNFKSHAPRPSSLVPIAGISLGILCILYAIIPHGIGLSEDSISYLSAARSLHDSGRMLDIDGAPFVAWAPLYSLAIAKLKFLPFRIESLLAVFNVLIYILTIATSWVLIQRSIDKAFFKITCLAAILFSFTLLQVYTMALSEGLFLLLINLVVLITARKRMEWGSRDFILLGLIFSLAMLQRYAGVFLALFFLLTFLSERNRQPATDNRQPLLLLAFLPIGLWLLRNWLAADTLIGFRSISIDRLGNNITVLADTLSSWILPMSIPLLVRAVLMVPLSYVLWYGIKGKNKVHWYVLSSYLMMLFACYLIFSFEEPRDRLLSPVFISLFLLLFSGLERLTADKSKNHALLITVLAGIWLMYPVTRTIKHIQVWHHEGVEGYNNPSRKESQVISWLRENEIPGKIFSNDAPAIYYFTGKNACRVPKAIYSFDEFERLVENGSHLVWWENRDLYDLQTIQKNYILEVAARLNDGAVFVIHK